MQWGHNGCSGDAVDAVDTVNVDAKRSTHTVYLANMGGGDRYL